MDTTISVEQLRPEFAELLEKSEKIGGSNKPMIEVVSPEEAKHMVLNMSDFLWARASSYWQVPGAKHSHYLELAMTSGELMLNHLVCVDKLEKLVAENLKLRAEADKAANN